MAANPADLCVNEAAAEAHNLACLTGILDGLLWDISFDGMEAQTATQLHQALALARVTHERAQALSEQVEALPRVKSMEVQSNG